MERYRTVEYRTVERPAEESLIRPTTTADAPDTASSLTGLLFQANEGPKRHIEAYRQGLIVLVLVLSDVLLALLVWGAAFVLQSPWKTGPHSAATIASVASSVVVWVGLRALLGLYPGYGLDRVEELRRQTYAVLATLAITTIFALALQVGGDMSRLVLGLGVLGLLMLAPLVRPLMKRSMMKIGLWGKPVVVVGAFEAGARLLRVLQQEWQLGFRPVGVFDNRVAPIEGMLEGVPYGGTLADATALSRRLQVNTAVFAMPYTRREHVAKLVNVASLSFRHVMVIPNLGGMTNSAVVARDLAGILGVEVRHNLLDPWARRVKRLLDILGAVLGGLLISPLLLTLTVLIKLDSRGPVFYGHQRLGAEDVHFRCWKFRTMHTNAEQLLDEYLQGNPDLRAEWEQSFKLRSDPRVTRIGRFLRKTSLDELPQLWNVLWGEMSLVGPRPIVDAEVPKYGTVYELYKRIKPGMSGFWQVGGRSDTSYHERVRMDAYYVQNWSTWLDLVILARTVWHVMLSRGAY
jgi:Undecaprenyl-phosphate galactose phosphotransferase WbaP